MLKPCLDCGVLASGSRCGPCGRAQDRRRGTSVERFGAGWGRISRQVIARDQGICHLCGESGADTADHLVPRSLGGDRATSACWRRRTGLAIRGVEFASRNQSCGAPVIWRHEPA